MTKRLISLVLCVLMLMSVLLTSCAEEELELNTSASAITLTMLAVTDTQVYYTEEEYAALSEEEKAHVDAVKAQYDAVEEAINKITKSKYKTQLDIFYYTADQYYEMLEMKMHLKLQQIDANEGRVTKLNFHTNAIFQKIKACIGIVV